MTALGTVPLLPYALTRKLSITIICHFHKVLTKVKRLNAAALAANKFNIQLLTFSHVTMNKLSIDLKRLSQDSFWVENLLCNELTIIMHNVEK